MARNILIIDKFSATRALLRTYIEAELSDVVIREADSLAAGQRYMDQDDIHLLIISDRLPGLDRVVFRDSHDRLRHVAVAVPTLLLTTDHRPDRLQRLRQQGFEEFLETPVSAHGLAGRINDICPPSRLRAFRRYHAPNSAVWLRLGNVCVAGRLVNFSRNGVLCEMEFPPPHPGEEEEQVALGVSDLGRSTISLHFPPELENIRLENMPCRLVGIKVLRWHSDNRPKRVRVEWYLTGPAPHEMTFLEQALRHHEEGHPLPVA